MADLNPVKVFLKKIFELLDSCKLQPCFFAAIEMDGSDRSARTNRVGAKQSDQSPLQTRRSRHRPGERLADALVCSAMASRHLKA